MEVSDPCLSAAIADVSDPIWVAPAESRATLPTCNNPVDSCEIQFIHRSKQWFRTDEPNARWNLPEIVCPPSIFVRFDRHTDPYVRPPRERLSYPREPLRTLGKNLIDVLIRIKHRVEYSVDELVGDILMEQIGH